MSFSYSGRQLFRSDRVEIAECDWAVLSRVVRTPDPTMRSMIVLDQGRVLLDGASFAPWEDSASAFCTVFRFPAHELGESAEPRVGRVTQLIPRVMFHFYRRRRALLMQLSAPDSHAEEDSLALLRFAESPRSMPVKPTEYCGRRRATSDVVPRAQALIRDSIDQPHHVRELAARLGTSPFHLAHMFTREVGTSLHQYLLHLRLLAALDRLRDGVTDLSRLAVGLGFTHHSHFSALFRRSVGQSPSEARRMLTAGPTDAPFVPTHCCPDVLRAAH